MTQIPYFINVNGILVRLMLEEILFIETTRNYSEIHLIHEKYRVRSSLSTLLKRLPEGLFLRTHRSYAVSKAHIDAVTRNFVILRPVADGRSVPLSKEYYSSFMAHFISFKTPRSFKKSTI